MSSDFVLGKDGQPLTDRYGRPLRKRGSTPSAPPAPQVPAAPREPRREAPRRRPDRPRQYMPGDDDYQPRRVPDYHSEPRPQRRPDRCPPAPRPTARPQRRAPRVRRRGPGCMPTLLTALLVFIVVGTLLADARLTRVDALPDTPIGDTAGTNWLIVGSDSRQGLSDEDVERLGTGGDIGQGRTDTIMLAHIPTTGKATLLSIPRDSYVEIPGYGMDKINAAFAYGGPKLLSQTVENATGLHIDHYAEIGMGGLAGVTDAIGGVEMCPTEPIQDPLANLDVQAGCQKMDGPTALGYVRTRATAMGDLDRVQRQREFLSALMHSVVSPGVLLNPLRLIPLVLKGSGMFIVGQSDHIWHLARLAFAMRGGAETETVPIGTFADTEVGSVLVWDDVQAEQLFARLR